MTICFSPMFHSPQLLGQSVLWQEKYSRALAFSTFGQCLVVREKPDESGVTYP